MIGATLCSGIGAPEVAAPWVDWRLASEIEPFPREVLAHRFGYRDPEAQNQGEPLLWGDMSEITPALWREHGIPLPEIIVAGTPCQSFSVAGLRKGLNDDRGNLTLKFVEICHAIVNARPDGRLIVLWENVPGVLSDKGNAFGAFLGGMVGGMDALRSPDGGSWPGEGMVQGPRARAAWAVLDAQWFGVAQRRRRVFAVFDFGNAVDPAAVLFDRDSLRGDSPPCRETGQGIAGTLSARPTGGGGLGTDFDLDGGLIASHDPACTLTARERKGALPEADLSTVVAPTLKAEGFDASEDGTGRGTPIVPVAIQERAVSTNVDAGPDGAGFRQDGTAYTLEARSTVQAVAFDCKGTEVQFTDDGSHPTLRSMGHNSSHANAGGHAAVAFDMRGREGGAMMEGPHDTANIRAASGGSSRSYVALPWAVRRLTGRECERLQGFEDDHTLIPRDRKRVLKDLTDEIAYLRQTYPDMTEDEAKHLAADGPRYKALGNSMAVSVVRWIMDRIRISAAELRGMG